MPNLEASPAEAAFFSSGGTEVAESLTTGLPPEPAPAPEPEPAPQPEAKAAPESKEEAKAEPEAKPEDPADKAKYERLVPYGAVAEERGKRKTVEEQLRAANEELAKLRANPVQPPAPKPEEQGIDPLADIEQLKQWKADREKQERETAERTAFSNHVQALEREYVAKNPDYPEAVQYLKEFRERQMRAVGLSDQQIAYALAQEAHDTARHAVMTEQSPAEVFHALAKASGWTPKSAQPAAPPKPAAEERLAVIEQGQKAAKSMSTGGGGAPESELSLAAMAKLDGADFDALWKKGGAARRLMA